MMTMFGTGYNPYNTWVSLLKRKFNDAMTIYVMLQNQRTQEAGCTFPVKLVHLEVGPCLPPADPSTFPLLLKRNVSKPPLLVFPC